MRYLRDWSVSQEYEQIKQGNYKKSPASGAVDVEVGDGENQEEVENLRQQIEELQREINKMRDSR